MTAAAEAPTKKKRGRPSKEEIAARAEQQKRAAFDASLPSERGGARPNAGRKSAAVEAGSAEAHIIYAKARAKKEAMLAQMAELDYRKKAGELLEREEVRTASATMLSIVAQAMRSIPDNLERKLGVSPEVAEEVSIMIDEAMANLADELERIHGGD